MTNTHSTQQMSMTKKQKKNQKTKTVQLRFQQLQRSKKGYKIQAKQSIKVKKQSTLKKDMKRKNKKTTKNYTKPI